MKNPAPISAPAPAPVTTFKWLDSEGVHTVSVKSFFEAIEFGWTFVSKGIFPAENGNLVMNSWISYQN